MQRFGIKHNKPQVYGRKVSNVIGYGSKHIAFKRPVMPAVMPPSGAQPSPLEKA